MGILPSIIPLVALTATGLGLFGIAATNWSTCPGRAHRARLLFVLVFLAASASCVGMAFFWTRGVLPFGLTIAILFLGVMWPHQSGVEENDSVQG